MAIIEQEQLGLRFELPDLRQRDVEEYFRRYREIKAGLTGIAPAQFRDEMVEFVKSLHKVVKGMETAQFTAAITEFSAGLRITRERAGKLTGPERNGLDVRTAIGCGWLGEMTGDDVDDLRPAAVTWLAAEINDLISEAYEIPGE